MSAPLPEGVVHEHPEGCTLAVRVQPGAKKTVITGVYDVGDLAALKIAVQAPPVDGRANVTLIEYLAKLLGLPRSSVSISHGQTGRSKLVVLHGVRAAQVRAALMRTVP